MITRASPKYSVTDCRQAHPLGELGDEGWGDEGGGDGGWEMGGWGDGGWGDGGGTSRIQNEKRFFIIFLIIVFLHEVLSMEFFGMSYQFA